MDYLCVATDYILANVTDVRKGKDLCSNRRKIAFCQPKMKYKVVLKQV